MHTPVFRSLGCEEHWWKGLLVCSSRKEPSRGVGVIGRKASCKRKQDLTLGRVAGARCAVPEVPAAGAGHRNLRGKVTASMLDTVGLGGELIMCASAKCSSDAASAV